MSTWKELLSHIAPVLTFDYPYREAGSSRPDPLPTLIKRHSEALRWGKSQYGEHAILIGKSMGGRVGCHVAAHESCLAAICLGYPLRGQSGKLRDQALIELPVPALLVQGTRDALCNLEELQGVLAQRVVRSELLVVESGDHSLIPTRKYLKQHNLTDQAVRQTVCNAISRFAASVATPDASRN
jgi:uncharacterized protein